MMFTFSPRLKYSHMGIADPELEWIHTAHIKNTEQYIIFDAIFADFSLLRLLVVFL